MDITAVAFLMFLTLWALGPPYWYWSRFRKFNLTELIFGAIAVLGLWFLLAMTLAFMNAITYNGIFNWEFWTS